MTAQRSDGTKADLTMGAPSRDECLVRITRLASLQELLAFVAHDVNQPLGSISASAEAALRWLDRPDPAVAEAVESLNRVLAHKDRAAEVIASLRGNLPAIRSGNATCLDDALERAIAALGIREISPLIDISAGAGSPALAAIGSVEAEILFLQLLKNAWEAIGRDANGRVGVRFSRGGNKLIIDISDSGPGIAEVYCPFLFDPFFTTRRHADGLGLSICRSLVRGAGGRLDMLSTSDTGTTFRVELPLAKVAG